MQSCIFGYVFKERSARCFVSWSIWTDTYCVWLECKTYLTRIFYHVVFLDFLFFPKNPLLIYFFCWYSFFFLCLSQSFPLYFLSFFPFFSFLESSLSCFLLSYTYNSPSYSIAPFSRFLFSFPHPIVDLIHPISELLSSLKHLLR